MKQFCLIVLIFIVGACCGLRYKTYMVHSLEGDTWADTLKLVVDGIDGDVRRVRAYFDQVWGEHSADMPPVHE